MTRTRNGWRDVDGVATAWFDASSLAEGAALAALVVDLAPSAMVDVRTSGLRVRLGAADAAVRADAVSAAARDLGLTADPTVLQRLSIVFETSDPPGVRQFWQAAIAGHREGDEALAEATRLIAKHDALEATRERARHFAQRAIDALSIFPDGAARRAMTEAAEFAVARGY